MFALLIAEQFAPFHDSHIEKVTVNGDPETRACIRESIVPRAVISQIPGKVGAKKHRAAQSVSSGHAWPSFPRSRTQIVLRLRFGSPIRRWCEDSMYSPKARRGRRYHEGGGSAAQHEDRTPTHGYEPTREAAMAVFGKIWRRK